MNSIAKDYELICNKLKSSNEFNISTFERLKNDTSELVALKILAKFLVTFKECLRVIESGKDIDFEKENIWKALHKISGTSELIGLNNIGRRSRQLSHIIKNSVEKGFYSDDLNLYIRQAKSIELELKILDHEITYYL
ncbi:MAG: hypothetical protein K1X29_05175 [Bdellovibrionales bacterium]|nr:hypothetical protein [Bdellovibrionales bacterium]